ncbi:hypothetical protein [Phenylobacterium immobile]|uniref:hypothetical protein n=1 Tax=Phenylobacterium immobile TaxID=21 RepID=UPI000A9657AD|nr:hypothetical protein [Phenylobacterium immobile]
MIRAGLIALLALASAGAAPAHADDAQGLRAAVYAASSSKAGPTAQTRARLAATRSTGIARTAIDQKISDGLTGSLGFMCGNARAYAPNSPLGYDPAGRFVGAKLGLAF